MNASLFFDNFSLLANSPNGVQKLREMILQLAVMGKLVPQDPNDEPASVLLEKIREEKEIAKSKSLKAIEEDEITFELPNGWQWVRVVDIYELSYGKSLPSNVRSDDGPIPVYGSNGVVGYHNECLVSEPSLIIGRKGSSGAVNLVNQSCWPIDTTYYVIPPHGIDLAFSYYQFKSLNLERFNKATAIPGLNRQDAYSLVVGLPPLEEQKRIVAKVDQLMTLCDELEALHQHRNESRVHINNAAINKLLDAGSVNEFNELWRLIYNNFDLLYDNLDNVAKLRKTILQLAVMGKLVPQDPNDEPTSVLLERRKGIKVLPQTEEDGLPHIVPRTWNWVKLVDIGQIVGGGTPKTSNPEYFCDKGVSWLTPADLYNFREKYIAKGKRDITELGLKNSSAQLMPAGTVLFSSRAPIGYVAIALNDISTNQGFKSCVPHIMEMNEYIYYFLKSAVRDIENAASGTTFKEISGKAFGQILIPLPPLEEQKRIVAKVDQLMTLCDELEMRIRKSHDDGGKITNAVVSNLTAM